MATEAQLAREKDARMQRTPPTTHIGAVRRVDLAELKTFDRDHISGDDFNRCVATARVLAASIANRLTPFGRSVREIGDPYSELTGWDIINSHEDVKLLNKLLVFLNAD